MSLRPLPRADDRISFEVEVFSVLAESSASEPCFDFSTPRISGVLLPLPQTAAPTTVPAVHGDNKAFRLEELDRFAGIALLQSALYDRWEGSNNRLLVCS